VATPTSGFQQLAAPGLHVVDAGGFLEAVATALAGPREFSRSVPTWADRAREFGAVVSAAAG
jgi:hypothetical protein